MDAAQTKVDEDDPTLVVAVVLGADPGLPHEGGDRKTRGPFSFVPSLEASDWYMCKSII